MEKKEEFKIFCRESKALFMEEEIATSINLLCEKITIFQRRRDSCDLKYLGAS